MSYDIMCKKIYGECKNYDIKETEKYIYDNKKLYYKINNN